MSGNIYYQVSFRTLTSGGFAASSACQASGLSGCFCVHLFGLILKGGGVWWWGCMPRHSRNLALAKTRPKPRDHSDRSMDLAAAW